MTETCSAPQDKEYCLIPLSQGQFAKVSPHRLEELKKHKWCAAWAKCTQSFYAMRKERLADGTRANVQMHREILGLTSGDENQGDHENGDTLDNRDGNLRVASRVQNARNRKIHKNNTTGYKGVSVDSKSGRFRAMIRKNGRHTHIGFFDTPESAHVAYCRAAQEFFGKFWRAS